MSFQNHACLSYVNMLIINMNIKEQICFISGMMSAPGCFFTKSKSEPNILDLPWGKMQHEQQVNS
jgi:hypothetical protein